MSNIRSRYRTVADGFLRRLTFGGDDRGDVPGWVLITVMTVGLVTVLWAVADEKLGEMFTEAMTTFGKG